MRGVGWYFYLTLILRLRLRLGRSSLLFFSSALPDKRLLMVFVSKDNLGGDFRIISTLLSLKVLLFCSSVLQLLNIKLSFKCCPYIRSNYSLSKKTLNTLCQLMFFNKAVGVYELRLLYQLKFAVELKDVYCLIVNNLEK